VPFFFSLREFYVSLFLVCYKCYTDLLSFLNCTNELVIYILKVGSVLLGTLACSFRFWFVA
jgi:hypothetical protein